MKSIHDSLIEQFGPLVHFDEKLAKFTTLKIGGNAEFFIEANNEQALLSTMQFARHHGIPVSFLGGGSNVFISDKGVSGLVLRNATSGITIAGVKSKRINGKQTSEVLIEVQSGTIMNALVRHTCDNGWSGLEVHLGLPGTVGGAVTMNSKWTKPVIGYVGDVVCKAKLLHKDGSVETVDNEYFHFSYDYSRLQETDDILLSVLFLLEKQSKDIVWETANESMLYRKKTQPQGVFSAGCTFQNISNADARIIPTPNFTTSAGYLIDSVGLKGFSIGNVQISPTHANFIINTGNATSSDMVKLIDLVQKKIYEKYHIVLKEEIKRMGAW